MGKVGAATPLLNAIEPRLQTILKIKDRSQNNGILVGEVRGYVPLAVGKRGAIVDMHAGSCNGGVAFSRPSNDVRYW